jgi:hypothetical protein
VRSKKNGGLVILHLGKFTRALRLRWLWRAWNPEDKPWVGDELPCNEIDHHLFAAATTITIGNGEKISFWNSAWIQGLRQRTWHHPSTQSQRKKNRTLQEALTGNTWIKDLDLLHPSFSARLFAEFVQLWKNVQQVNLRPHVQDEISWNFNESGQFSTSSAYHAQFIGAIGTNLNEIIWSAWASPKCKFFSWLVVQDRIWTADRLQARGWMHNPACVLCRRIPKTGMHLFSKCRVTRRIWTDISTWLEELSLHPTNWKQTASVYEWWSALAETQGVQRFEIPIHPCMLGSLAGAQRSQFQSYRSALFLGDHKNQR